MEFVNRDGNYADIVNFPIDNVTARVRFRSATSDEVMLYYITPNEGYVLHDKRYDTIITDEETGEETVVLGYRRTTASCSKTQFDNDTYEFYAVLEDSVPADQIRNATVPHEVMSVEETETE